MEHLKERLEKKDYVAVINDVKTLVAKDRRAFSDPDIKAWCGARWRNLFLQEAVKDRKALKVARQDSPKTHRKKPGVYHIADRFLMGDARAEWKIEMPEAQIEGMGDTTFVFCPGLLNGLLPVRAFTEAFPEIEEEYDLTIIRSDSHPFRDSEANIPDLLNAINDGQGLAADTSPIGKGNAKKPKDVVLMGYSKGSADVLHVLAAHPELKDRIRCFFSWAGAVGGAYSPDGLYESIKDLDLGTVKNMGELFPRIISPFVNTQDRLRRLDEYDVEAAILGLTTYKSQEYLDKNGPRIDALDIPIFNIAGATVISEVPSFQILDTLKLNKYDVNNDMQLTQEQAKVPLPMATDLAMLHGNHWDLSYGQFPRHCRMASPNLDHPFPKKAAVVAIIKFAAELGLMD